MGATNAFSSEMVNVKQHQTGPICVQSINHITFKLYTHLMNKTTMAKQEKSYNFIKRLMEEAGTYDPRYEAQIEDAADTRDLVRGLRKALGNQFKSTELKTGGIDTKDVGNPITKDLLAAKKEFRAALCSLGLNYDGYKKPTNKKAESESIDENDPTAEYFNSING